MLLLLLLLLLLLFLLLLLTLVRVLRCHCCCHLLTPRYDTHLYFFMSNAAPRHRFLCCTLATVHRRPFNAQNQLSLAMKINTGRVAPIPSRYSPELFATIEWMLNKAVSCRSRTVTVTVKVTVQIPKNVTVKVISTVIVIAKVTLTATLAIKVAKEVAVTVKAYLTVPVSMKVTVTVNLNVTVKVTLTVTVPGEGGAHPVLLFCSRPFNGCSTRR